MLTFIIYKLQLMLSIKPYNRGQKKQRIHSKNSTIQMKHNYSPTDSKNLEPHKQQYSNNIRIHRIARSQRVQGLNHRLNFFLQQKLQVLHQVRFNSYLPNKTRVITNIYLRAEASLGKGYLSILIEWLPQLVPPHGTTNPVKSLQYLKADELIIYTYG